MHTNRICWMIAGLFVLGIVLVPVAAERAESRRSVVPSDTSPLPAGFSLPTAFGPSTSVDPRDPTDRPDQPVVEEDAPRHRQPAVDEEEEEEEVVRRERHEASRREAEEREREGDREVRRAEQELERIARELHEAERRGERDRAAELREVAERLELELTRERENRHRGAERSEQERFEREQMDRRQAEEFERQSLQEVREMELQRTRVSLERAELESSFGRLETITRLAQIADNELTAATYAVMHVERFMELPAAVDFLNHMLKETEHPGIRRVIRIHLLELNGQLDRRDDAREQLEHLILE